MASKNAVMSDRSRQVFMDMKKRKKAAKKLENDATFDGVISVLKVIAVIIMIAGTLWNYGSEVGNFIAGNPATASAASENSK